MLTYIMEDKKNRICAYLDANGIKFESFKKHIEFNLYNGKDTKKIFWENGEYYLENFEYKPHIINHNKNRLCLTMDQETYRKTNWKEAKEIERVNEIIWELWDDPMLERFNELEYFLSISRKYLPNINNDLYLNIDEVYYPNSKNITNIYKNGFIYETIKFKMMKYDNSVIFDDKWLRKNKIKETTLIIYEYNQKKKFFIVFVKNKTKEFAMSGNINDYSISNMFNRTGRNKIISKRVLIIGCGSIGGYLARHLLDCGYKNITLCDHKNFRSYNTPRHYLGYNPNQGNISKAESLMHHFNTYYPFNNIETMKGVFNYGEDSIKKYDYIFITTGGEFSFKNNKIKSLLNKGKIIVDIFIEAYGAALHSIIYSGKNDYLVSVANMRSRSITDYSKDLRENFQSCLLPTLPYSSTPLKVGIILLLEDIFENNFKKGHLVLPMINLSKIEEKYLNKENLAENISNELKIKRYE